MLVVHKMPSGCKFMYSYTQSKYGGYMLWMDHLQFPAKIDRLTKVGLGGGFVRELDAQLAIRSLRTEWPDFDFDQCSYREFDRFVVSNTEKRIREITMRDLQW